MKTLILQFAIFGLATAVFADDSQNAQNVQFHPLTEKETVEVAQKLESFDKGTTTLDSLTGSQEWTMKILEYYVTHTNEVTTKMKLPIAKSYVVWSKYPEAIELAQDYVNVYSNDWRGWSVLGGCKLVMKSYNEAVDALTKAARLGDKGNYSALGGAALLADRLDVFERMAAPHLLMLINDAGQFPEKERNQMRGLLIVYALKTDNEPIFLKAIAKVDMGSISQWEELKDLIAQGCDHFKGADIDKIRQEMESATSSTNSVTSPPR